MVTIPVGLLSLSNMRYLTVHKRTILLLHNGTAIRFVVELYRGKQAAAEKGYGGSEWLEEDFWYFTNMIYCEYRLFTYRKYCWIWDKLVCGHIYTREC